MNMKKIGLLCVLTAITGMASGVSEAATKYVRPGATGNNSGSDWTNAYNGLPSALTRGDTFYLADGSYGSYTFDDANSSATTITIKKATGSDHGTDTGWSSGYGDGQAVFSGWQIYTDYYVFDGQVRNTDWRTGGVNQYGITTGNTRLDNGAGTGGDNLTFRNIDIHGGGRDTGRGDDVIYGLTGNSNINFQNCALHDSDRTIFLTRNNWQNLVVNQSYIARNTSTPAMHGEMMSVYSSTNMTFSNNVIEDIEGTAVWAGIGDGGSSGWKIYGNVIIHSAAYIANTGRAAGHNWGVAGAIFVANDATNNNKGNNILFYNNSIVNIQGSYSGVVIQSGTGNEVRNNVWYNSVRTNNSFSGTISNNWYYNTPQDGDSTATKTVCTSGCDIFTSISGKNLSLKAATSGGMALSAPYNIDMSGIIRGADGVWDRGAFEFGGSAVSVLLPPTNLRFQ
jgi:hypothetical protein